jgi:transcriptional/translational regulatory protein YebC/TACO1
MEKIVKVLQRLVIALEKSGCEYVIVGGLVAIHYGRSRITQDIDVVVDTKDIGSLSSALREQGFEFSDRDLEVAFEERSRVALFLPEDILFHVDLKFARDELDYEVLRGRVREEIMGVVCWMESAEDIIVAKLIYGSSQDEEDVIAVLLNRGINDKLKEKAKKFNVYYKLCGIAEMIGLRC